MTRIHYPTIPFSATIAAVSGEPLLRIWPSVSWGSFGIGFFFLVCIDPEPLGTSESGPVSAYAVLHEEGSFTIEFGQGVSEDLCWQFSIKEKVMYARFLRKPATEAVPLDAPSQELIEFVKDQIRRTMRSTATQDVAR